MEIRFILTGTTCCIQGHSRHRTGKQRDSKTGRFVNMCASMIPEQCWNCKQGVHHGCYQPEECGCDCADFIEVLN